MRLNEVLSKLSNPQAAIKKLEDPLTRKSKRLKDEAEKLDVRVKDRKQRERVDTARETLHKRLQDFTQDTSKPVE